MLGKKTKNSWEEFRDIVSNHKDWMIRTIISGPVKCPPGALKKLAALVDTSSFDPNIVKNASSAAVLLAKYI